MVKETTVQELNARLQSGDKPILVDVREAHELDICKLPYDFHIPLGEVPNRYSELDPESELVIYCRSGGRSGKAAEFLVSKGFKNVTNMVGGVLEWGREIDPSFPPY